MHRPTDFDFAEFTVYYILIIPVTHTDTHTHPHTPPPFIHRLFHAAILHRMASNRTVALSTMAQVRNRIDFRFRASARAARAQSNAFEGFCLWLRIDARQRRCRRPRPHPSCGVETSKCTGACEAWRLRNDGGMRHTANSCGARAFSFASANRLRKTTTIRSYYAVCVCMFVHDKQPSLLRRRRFDYVTSV